MLTGRLVRVQLARDRVVPQYIDVTDPMWAEVAARLLDLVREGVGRSRGELDGRLREAGGDDPRQLVPPGLAKLLMDRCTFEVVADHPPDQLRERVFLAAARQRSALGPSPLTGFDRGGVLQAVAGELGVSPD